MQKKIFYFLIIFLLLNFLFANDISSLSKSQQIFLKTIQDKIDIKDYGSAIKELEKELKSNNEAKNYYVYFLLGTAYYLIKNVDKALENYLIALNYNPNGKEINFNIGKIYYEKNEFNKAAKFFKNILNIENIPSKELLQILINCYLLQNDLVLADQIIQKAIYFYPDDIQFRLLLIQIKINQENYSDAEALTKSFLKIFPDNQELYLYLAKFKILKNEIDEAINELNKIIYLNKTNKEALNLLGQLYSMKGMYKETIKYLTENDKNLSPDDLFLLVKAYYNIGRFNEALNTFEKIPENKRQIEHKLFKCKILYELNKYEEAIKELENLKNYVSNNGEIYLLNGLCYIKLKNYNKAEKELEIAKLFSNVREHSYAALGEIKLYKGEIDNALNYFKEALNLNLTNENYQQIISTLQKMK